MCFTVLIPLDEVFNEWKKTDGPAHIKRIAEHYGVFESLFGDAFFYPVSPLSIAYKVGQDEYAPVYFGNQIKPREVSYFSAQISGYFLFLTEFFILGQHRTCS